MRARRNGRGVLLVTIVLAAGLVAGCAGGDATDSPRDRSLRVTLEGSYQVKGIEDGRTRGVGIYSNGSFRVIEEDVPRMVIYNNDTGEGWLVNLAQNTYEQVAHDEALLRAGFMPHMVMKPYLELEQFWEGMEFRMDAEDGRSIRAWLDGPEYLPGVWVVESKGKPFKEITWEYRLVGRVSSHNFRLPDGLTPR